MNQYQTGNTITLEAEFRDKANALIDPTIVKVIFYNADHKKLNEVVIPPEGRISLGKYFYNYVAPYGLSSVVYEWYGEIAGFPSIGRSAISLNFL